MCRGVMQLSVEETVLCVMLVLQVLGVIVYIITDRLNGLSDKVTDYIIYFQRRKAGRNIIIEGLLVVWLVFLGGVVFPCSLNAICYAGCYLVSRAIKECKKYG